MKLAIFAYGMACFMLGMGVQKMLILLAQSIC